MTEPMVAIIGAGNMGGSLIRGLIGNQFSPQQIWAVDADAEKLKLLANETQIQTTTVIEEALHQANVVLFAIKPQLFQEVVLKVKDILLQRKPLIISIAAGITTTSITQWIGANLSMVRAMPNTPALIGCGISALYATPETTQTERQFAQDILQVVGTTLWVQQESWLDIVTAISGSGPAYFFYMMEALEKSASELGLPTELSHTLVLQTAYGSALLAIESGQPLSTLREQVTSKGGTTEKAIATMEEHQLSDIFRKAVEAAKVRAEELAKG